MKYLLTSLAISLGLIGCAPNSPPADAKVEPVVIEMYVTHTSSFRERLDIEYLVVGSPTTFKAWGDMTCFPDIQKNVKYTLRAYSVNGNIRPSTDLCRIDTEIKVYKESQNAPSSSAKAL